jgi:hypothetical protein
MFPWECIYEGIKISKKYFAMEMKELVESLLGFPACKHFLTFSIYLKSFFSLRCKKIYIYLSDTGELSFKLNFYAFYLEISSLFLRRRG